MLAGDNIDNDGDQTLKASKSVNLFSENQSALLKL